jgi:hypothetical protein
MLRSGYGPGHKFSSFYKKLQRFTLCLKANDKGSDISLLSSEVTHKENEVKGWLVPRLCRPGINQEILPIYYSYVQRECL